MFRRWWSSFGRWGVDRWIEIYTEVNDEIHQMISQIVKHLLKMAPKSIQNLSKTYKNLGLGAFGRILGDFGAPGRSQNL